MTSTWPDEASQPKSDGDEATRGPGPEHDREPAQPPDPDTSEPDTSDSDADGSDADDRADGPQRYLDSGSVGADLDDQGIAP